MRIKFTAFCLMLLCVNLFASEKLNMNVEVKRYFDSNDNTTFVIDYQVPYRNLLFEERDNGYFAELKITFFINNADSVVYQKEFINNIGVSQKHDVSSSTKSFYDRISLTLSKPDFKLNILFEDLKNSNQYEWEYQTQLLDINDKLSDIELISVIFNDTTSFSQKYIKHGKIYKPEPSGMISKDLYDTLYIHCEAYNVSSETGKAILTIKQNGSAYLITSLILNPGLKSELLFPITLDNMPAGKYSATIDYAEQDIGYSRSIDFIISEKTERLFFLFSDPDEESLLMKYLISDRSFVNWDTLSREAKRRKISQLWMELASKNAMDVEQMITMYKSRIDYSNNYFSHFAKGWKTDMGRIYIRNGKPSEIEKDVPTEETKYVKKDYQIWKYANKNHSAYLFVDIPMNGNYKLVYVINDDEESSYPNWRKYLGSNFDESLLEN